MSWRHFFKNAPDLQLQSITSKAITLTLTGVFPLKLRGIKGGNYYWLNYFILLGNNLIIISNQKLFWSSLIDLCKAASLILLLFVTSLPDHSRKRFPTFKGSWDYTGPTQTISHFKVLNHNRICKILLSI